MAIISLTAAVAAKYIAAMTGRGRTRKGRNSINEPEADTFAYLVSIKNYKRLTMQESGKLFF